MSVSTVKESAQLPRGFLHGCCTEARFGQNHCCAPDERGLVDEFEVYLNPIVWGGATCTSSASSSHISRHPDLNLPVAHLLTGDRCCHVSSVTFV